MLKPSNFEGNSDPYLVTLKELGSAFLITGCTSRAPLARNPLLDTLGSLREDHFVKPRRTLPDGKANKREEMMLFHGALSNK